VHDENDFGLGRSILAALSPQHMVNQQRLLIWFSIVKAYLLAHAGHASQQDFARRAR